MDFLKHPLVWIAFRLPGNTIGYAIGDAKYVVIRRTTWDWIKWRLTR